MTAEKEYKRKWREANRKKMLARREMLKRNKLNENKSIYKVYGFYENGELKLTEAGKRKLND